MGGEGGWGWKLGGGGEKEGEEEGGGEEERAEMGRERKDGLNRN